MLSKQSRTTPPWLQSQDRPSLDYQAGKKGLLLSVWIRLLQVKLKGLHVKRRVCETLAFVCGKTGEKLPSHESASGSKRATRHTVREYVIPTAHSSSD